MFYKIIVQYYKQDTGIEADKVQSTSITTGIPLFPFCSYDHFPAPPPLP